MKITKTSDKAYFRHAALKCKKANEEQKYDGIRDKSKKKPDEIQGSELSQWNPYGTHLLLPGNACVLFVTTLIDEHLYGTSERFENQCSMYHYSFGLHDQQEPTHHQNSARSKIIFPKETGK